MDFIITKTSEGKMIGGDKIRQHYIDLKPGIYINSVKRRRNYTSNKQRSVWWIWMNELEKATGNSRWYFHYFLKLKFGRVEWDADGMPLPESINDHNTMETSTMMAQVQQWAFEKHGVRLEYLEDSKYSLGETNEQGD